MVSKSGSSRKTRYACRKGRTVKVYVTKTKEGKTRRRTSSGKKVSRSVHLYKKKSQCKAACKAKH